MKIELEEGVNRIGRESKTKFLARGGKLRPLILKLLDYFGITPLSPLSLSLVSLVVSRITMQLVF